jgi:hypothetical protein
MFYLFALAILLGSFILIFGLWFVIWSVTMNGSEVAQALAEDRHITLTR